MNDTKLSPDDPRLTAYALGELEGAERTAVEAMLKNDAAAQAAVEEIRATAQQIEAALAAEAAAPEIVPPITAKLLTPYAPARKLVPFPYWLVGGLAAACLAVVLTLHEQSAVRLARQERADLAARQEAMDRKATIHRVSMKSAAPTADKIPSGYTEVILNSPAGANNPPAQLAVADQPAAPANKQAVESPAADETIKLPTFEVTASKTTGYQAANSVSGTRVNTKIAELPFSISAVSEKTMRDLGGTRVDASGTAVTNSAGYVSPPRAVSGEFNTEAYAYHADNEFLSVAQNPLSTFALDVDTASYANVRRFLQAGQRPPADAVRIEELVNYFPYAYEAPRGEAPLAATLEVAAAPWAPAHRLVRIGLKARDVTAAARPAANLVFLIDVSGSMDEPDKLPLLQQSLRLLLGQLRADDRVAIVTYAGESSLALPSTPASHRREIAEVLDALHAAGSTNGGRGLELAYDIAKANFITGGVNRVILATDGDFNVGLTDEGGLVRLVEEKARSGVELTALGFGTGNYKDAMFKQLADKGHGNYGYVDTPDEARKLLAEQVGGTLVTVARDVKAQVEFNPAKVVAYRLIGYDDRVLKKEDFNHDAITAGEVGAGRTVTALYEIVPAGAEPPATPGVDALKYGKAERREPRVERPESAELLTVKVRYTPPEGGASRRLEFPLTDRGAAFAEASADFKFAAAVAGFGMILRDSPYKGSATWAAVEQWAGQGLGTDAGGWRAEFVGLVRQAGKLSE
ncbi:MAG: von Willebrand factor type A domain-containing protein [Opitutaceae bacterium]